MSDDDEFYALRTAFYIGDYNKVEKEYKNLNNLSGLKAKERDSFKCRSLIAQNKFKEANKLAKGEATPLLAVKQLSLFKQATTQDARDIVIDKLKEYLTEQSVLDNITFCVITSSIFLESKLYRTALEIVQGNNSLEKLLMQCQIYLAINRHDLALKSLIKMQDLEDDDALTQIAQISLCLYHGGANKVNEALELIDDLISAANNPTILLTNMQCVANMHLKNFSEAWKLCKLSRDLAKKLQQNNPKFEFAPATLINSIICLQNLNKGHDILPKLYSELKRIAPNHEFIKEREEMEALFDKAAGNFKL